MIRKATLRIGIPVLLVYVVVNAYLAADHLRQMQKREAVTREAVTTQASISDVLKDLVDLETSQRGYLLTGDQSYLDLYSATKSKIDRDLASLRADLSARPEDQRAQEAQLEGLAKSKQVEMERTIDLRQHGYRHRAFTMVSTNEGKGYMDEARRIGSALASAESSNLSRLDRENSLALRKMFSMTIIANGGLLLLAACLFGLFRYHSRLLAQEAVQSTQDLALRDSQLAKVTSALAGRARLNISALNTNSRLLLDNYGGFLPRQGHEYAEQLKEAATEMERLRLDLVDNRTPQSEPTAA